MEGIALGRERTRALRSLCGVLGVSFARLDLLHQALTHSSYANECKNPQVIHNERLEFLGDAVLDLVISTYLFRTFPDLPEGELTKARASIVCESTIARCAVSFQAGDYLLLGKGEMATGGRTRPSILADVFEAVIGAIYIDQGVESASQFVLRQLRGDLALLADGNYTRDYKTLLQEAMQKHGDCRIVYEIVGEAGPDHAKIFTVCVRVNDRECGAGTGKSKKEAEQRAAQEALHNLK